MLEIGNQFYQLVSCINIPVEMVSVSGFHKHDSMRDCEGPNYEVTIWEVGGGKCQQPSLKHSLLLTS